MDLQQLSYQKVLIILINIICKNVLLAMFIIAVEKKQGGPVTAQGMIVLCTVLGGLL